jgi:Bacteriophage related domain of unknown function
MASDAVMTAVEARISAAWTHTPVVTPNGATGMVPSDNTAFLAVSYPVANDEQISIGAPGNNVFREAGAFRVVLSIPVSGGRGSYVAWLDALRANLRNAEFSGVRCWAPNSVTTNDQSDNGGYFELSFATPYFYDYLA